MNKALVLYTHTDMQDVWPMCFGQLDKYLADYKLYLFIDKKNDSIPASYYQIEYDDKLLYTDRLQQCLDNVAEQTILFLHEDMILYDKPNYEYLDLYTKLVEEDQVDSIKLISVGEIFLNSYIDPTLVVNESSKFSIQPTILKKKFLQDLIKKVGSLNIWDFEKHVSGLQSLDCMARQGTEKKRGLYHYDSFVFPYIATAVVKGKWNYSEYKSELDALFEEYKVDCTKRGTV